MLGEKFATDYIHLSYSTDLYGIEYAAILKNIYALSVGIAVGLGYGDNFLAVLIANSAGEMRRFLEESYPAERDTLVSGYLGDLLVTCYSVYSRNRRLGLQSRHADRRHGLQSPLRRRIGPQVHERTDNQINLTITWKRLN